MNFEELKKKALQEHEEIEKVVDFYGCSYLDAKNALQISEEKSCSIEEALKDYLCWKSAEFVPKPEND